MNICVISLTFPTTFSISFMFLEQLCREFVKSGHTVTVITRQSITKHYFRNIPYAPSTYEIKEGLDVIKVLMPKIFTFGNGKLSIWSFNQSAYKTLNSLNFKPDIIYAHFWESALAGLQFAKDNNIPLFVASGEDYIILHKQICKKRLKDLRDYVSGVICVSSKIKQESIETGLVNDISKCLIAPNAINPSLFCVKDKKILREKYGYSKDDFIVAFVGQFNNRKGILRINQALKEIQCSNIKAIFIGSGPDIPDYNQILYCGIVEHDNIPDYLNCSDVFLLPTRSEGCCNAMIEAMGCGLPVISSNRSFNWDVLNDSNSILIEPDSVDDIKKAILQLYFDRELLNKLSQGAMASAKKLTLGVRASNILSFIKEKIS